MLAVFVIAALVTGIESAAAATETAGAAKAPSGVCPPFQLKDEGGAVINPAAGINDTVPYSPKQTCGSCHDYAKITRGYHFMQGAGEPPPDKLRQRAQWVSSPGNFGGSWCSPAPLYQYLSPKKNATSATMDMTAFTFVSSCGSCHPGGGSAEYDRDGRRYDEWISDPASGFSDGGENALDGDYFKARWGESGVLEADCLLCHLPGYKYEERGKQIKNLNYRWAASAGAGFAQVSGAVKESNPVTVAYDAKRFKPDGTIFLPMIRSPRNEACLSCHAQPGWKKRGANFRARTDVHLRAGLRCVDCHPAGSSATDPRISGREEHQFAKGDDPSGLVRNDLDNSMVTCEGCHDTGRLGAPRAKHRGLPPLHLDRIACQTCHIPERAVMPIQVQASDVFNPAPGIPTGGKQLWTFYGPDGNWRNHYGFLEMMGYDDKPTERFNPVLARYGGKIYPVNRVHSAWPGIQIDGQQALQQPRMSDIRKMWDAHRNDPQQYPALARITDDNGDQVIEVNRPDEIDALIESVTSMLEAAKYPLEKAKVVWVSNDRIYSSGASFTTLEKDPWEASPFANVHKFSHDIYPANAALGAKGCSDCHADDSSVLVASVLQYPFDHEGKPVKMAQADLLGIGQLSAWLGAFRETWLKPLLFWGFPLLLLLLLLHYIGYGPPQIEHNASQQDEHTYSRWERIAHTGLLCSFFGLAITGFMPFATRWLQVETTIAFYGIHRILGISFAGFTLLSGFNWWRDARFDPCDWKWFRKLGGYFGGCVSAPERRFNAGQKAYFWVGLLASGMLVVTGAFLIYPPADSWISPLFTLHVVLAALSAMAVLVHLYLVYFLNPHTLPKMIKGAANGPNAE